MTPEQTIEQLKAENEALRLSLQEYPTLYQRAIENVREQQIIEPLKARIAELEQRLAEAEQKLSRKDMGLDNMEVGVDMQRESHE